ncbi:MAG: tRNA (5-methylaminomethyl-2-thiouridine)(34)-methyltransferase MnmD [Bacteroidales bacterium]
METQLILTRDGSHSLYVPDLDEQYHSLAGAVTESKHVFIQNGYRQILQEDSLHVFEVGFGTGLNAWLTLLEAHQEKKKTVYHSIELFPLNNSTIKSLNYNNFSSGAVNLKPRDLHEAEWNEDILVSDWFRFRKIQDDLLRYKLENNFYHVVYFDAFAPDKQPELWTEEIFIKMYNGLRDKGILVTYSCKGSVRRLLQSIGFLVSRIPGPPGGKKEMIRAEKTG